MFVTRQMLTRDKPFHPKIKIKKGGASIISAIYKGFECNFIYLYYIDISKFYDLLQIQRLTRIMGHWHWHPLFRFFRSKKPREKLLPSTNPTHVLVRSRPTRPNYLRLPPQSPTQPSSLSVGDLFSYSFPSLLCHCYLSLSLSTLLSHSSSSCSGTHYLILSKCIAP